jgi:hypothetical protein
VISGVGTPLVERWDGVSWLVISSPARPGSTSDRLDGIARTPDSRFYAVGGSTVPPFSYTLLERYA